MSGSNPALGEIANEAAIERSSFLVDAARQLDGFLKANAGRIAEVGGLVLIDDDPDYLSVAPDGTFRSRTRFQDEATGEWVSETEVIESAAELVELYNAAEIYAAFADAAREAAGLPAEPTGTNELMEAAGIAPEERSDPYAGAADDWAAGSHAEPEEPTDAESAARLIYDMALTFQERSQESEAGLFRDFESAVGAYAHWIGETVVVDEDDERLRLDATGRFRAAVLPEEEPNDWRQLDEPEELVQFYDPTDVFGDLAESIAEAFPNVAPEHGEIGDSPA